MEDDQWKEKTNFLEKVGIHNFLGAPQIAKFDGWKEEDVKFLISRYDSGYLWIDYSIAITVGLIHMIIGIPHGVIFVPKTLNTNDWLQILTGGMLAKNSKGLLINRVVEPHAQWACIIVSL
jgi:hypothetical protein